MNTIDVTTPNKNYKIQFESGFDSLATSIKALNKSYSKIAIISDDIVGPLYTQNVRGALNSLDIEIFDTTFLHGEENKNFKTINQLYEFLIENQFDRKSLLIALGGGVTGDMVGFTAATYMRGVDFVQVPTSLLAQVDSSVGGKTGIDFNGYKNIVGAFYQPELVYINTMTLKTLPSNEFSSGMGEVIKHGCIMDETYVTFLEKHIGEIKHLDHEIISELVGISCQIKADVVSKDEKEQGLRAILNFGHTIGHAVERLKNFQMLHGECVAVGTIAASYLSYKLNHISLSDFDRIKSLVVAYDLPTEVFGLAIEDVYKELFYDKKTNHQQLNFILLEKIGACYQNKSLNKALVEEALREIIKEDSL